jgi:hypothetical protein
VNDANDDTDGDGVDNQDEVNQGTNPCNHDTNHDGVNDGHELSGTVVSFVQDSANPGSGTLTIQLADNSQVSGKVDSTTKIECDSSDEHNGSHAKHDGGGDQGSSPDTSGTAPSGSGDDDGPNHDANDNDADDNGTSSSCSSADLTPGAVVREAELQGTGDQAVFSKVELQK